MKLAGRHEYQTVAFTTDEIRVCLFRRHGQKFRLVRVSRVPLDEKNPGASLKQAFSDAGNGTAGCVILTGLLPGSSFFQCPGADLPPREQKNALEFELPLHLLKAPSACELQYVRWHTDGSTGGLLGVGVLPEQTLEKLAARLTQGKCKADEYLNALFGVKPGEPGIRLPDLEKDFYYENGEWHTLPENPEKLDEYWRGKASELLELPGENAGQELTFLLEFLVLRLLVSAELRTEEAGVRVLPSNLRPSRCRVQAITAVLLAVILGLGWLRGIASDQYKRYTAYRDLVSERDNYRRKTVSLKSKLKKGEKEARELQKIVAMEAGEPAFLRKLYDLTNALPSNVLTTSLRFNDGNCDLVLQSESTDLNLPRALKNLSYWKIAQLQQRTMGETIAMTILRLEPAAMEQKEGRKRK